MVPTDDALLAAVAARIVDARVASGMTQARAAEAIGMTLTNYQRIEAGGQNLTLRTLARLASGLGVGVSAFFTGRVRRRRRKPGRPRKPT